MERFHRHDHVFHPEIGQGGYQKDPKECNAELFRSNYGLIFVAILVRCIVTNVSQLLSIVAVVAVCIAFRIHENNETVLLWGYGPAMSKNHRLAAAALVAWLIFRAADVFVTVARSACVSAEIAMVHATLFAGPGTHIKFFPM
ncbi:hypothetical protein HPB50_028622 [Hyalomma asiaticum]|nr:hypothetical protein HPB50_028622 [Hyalomma asiaticum]